MDFWANRGEVFMTDAVSFVLAGQADPAAIIDSLTDYLKLFSLLGQYNTPEQQLQLLRVSQGVLKQAAQVMQDSAVFQAQSMHLMQQLLQVQCMRPVSCYPAALYHNQGCFQSFGLLSYSIPAWICAALAGLAISVFEATTASKTCLIIMQIDSAYHGDALEILTGSKLLRVSARAVKAHSQVAEVFDSAVVLLNMLLTVYKSSICFDALVEEVLDSNLALEVEIAIKALQVFGPSNLSCIIHLLQISADSCSTTTQSSLLCSVALLHKLANFPLSA